MSNPFGSTPISLWGRTKPMAELDFRDVEHQVIILFDDSNAFMGAALSEFPFEPGDNALILYGYIDHEAGISFEVLCFAYVDGMGSINLRPGNSTSSFKLRYDSVNGQLIRYANASEDINMVAFLQKIKLINNSYGVNPIVEKLRTIESLDPSRSPQFPDDLVVLFMKDGMRPEGIWCRLDGFDGRHITAQMLNEPYGDFGYHEGDIVPLEIVPMETDQRAVAILE